MHQLKRFYGCCSCTLLSPKHDWHHIDARNTEGKKAKIMESKDTSARPNWFTCCTSEWPIRFTQNSPVGLDELLNVNAMDVACPLMAVCVAPAKYGMKIHSALSARSFLEAYGLALWKNIMHYLNHWLTAMPKMVCCIGTKRMLERRIFTLNMNEIILNSLMVTEETAVEKVGKKCELSPAPVPSTLTCKARSLLLFQTFSVKCIT